MRLLNEKEKLVFKFIKDNPFLSQQEMAEQLGMSRPALANIISALIKRGEILANCLSILFSDGGSECRDMP